MWTHAAQAYIIQSQLYVYIQSQLYVYIKSFLHLKCIQFLFFKRIGDLLTSSQRIKNNYLEIQWALSEYRWTTKTNKENNTWAK